MSNIDGFNAGRKVFVQFSGTLSIGQGSEPLPGLSIGQPDELSAAAREYLRCRAEELRWKAKVFGGEDNRTTREAYYRSTAASKPARERLAKALKRAGAQAVRVGDKVVARVDRGGDLDSLRKKPKEAEFLTFGVSEFRF
jgi:hypothetical protein